MGLVSLVLLLPALATVGAPVLVGATLAPPLAHSAALLLAHALPLIR